MKSFRFYATRFWFGTHFARISGLWCSILFTKLLLSLSVPVEDYGFCRFKQGGGLHQIVVWEVKFDASIENWDAQLSGFLGLCDCCLNLSAQCVNARALFWGVLIWGIYNCKKWMYQLGMDYSRESGIVLIPTRFVWPYGGRVVYISGSFTGWELISMWILFIFMQSAVSS